MKIDFNDITERNRIAASFCVPLRLTRLGPDDMADHKGKLAPLLAEMVSSPPHRQAAMESCWSRFAATFEFN